MDKATVTYIQQRILEYARMATQDRPSETSSEPFKDHGLVFIHQPSFRLWIGETYHFYLSQNQAIIALAQLRAQPRLLNFHNKRGRKVYGINVEVGADEQAIQLKIARS
jgi:hypothetical protein